MGSVPADLDAGYCRAHDLYDCPYAHAPAQRRCRHCGLSGQAHCPGCEACILDDTARACPECGESGPGWIEATRTARVAGDVVYGEGTV